ncbi:MAG: hypothetical protein KatS3mg038_3386 [Candidatus Kapaibacterium sp.]|nr:MAG: hypothetical protein KatS3mg038_1169 [Candidatus Kapabacteria bacterium]GIV50689.1 MAG: hypothetical protein KatS3mg038_1210 [Candidatus Kapabacteria bacterium]GIV52865.1 MAG: hypothetical protein KatS3mg038_3386 [Candidatus Kapabacteria bacterium]
MKGKRGYTIKEILTAIEGSGGITSAVAQRLDCDWRTADKYIKKWDATRAAFEAERERVLDLAETTIVRAIRDGDVGAAKWYLSRMGRHRGWGDDVAINTGNIRVVVKWADDEDDEQ